MAELSIDEGDPQRPGGAVLDSGEFPCREAGCQRLAGFRTAAARGAHEWRSHGRRGAGPNGARAAGEVTPSRTTEARRLEERAPDTQPRLVAGVATHCSCCGVTFRSPAAYGGHLKGRSRCNKQTATPTQRAEDIAAHNREAAGMADEVDADTSDGDEPTEWARVVSVGISEQSEVDTLDAWCFLHGVADADEYVQQLVSDALAQARRDPDVASLIAMREARR